MINLFALSKIQIKTNGGGVGVIPAALSVTAPYPAPCGAAAPAVPAARYCKRSFGFARLSRFRSPRSVRMPRFSIGAQARYPCAPPPFRLPSAPPLCSGWSVLAAVATKNAPTEVGALGLRIQIFLKMTNVSEVPTAM